MEYDHLSDNTLLTNLQAAEFLGVSFHSLQIWRTTGRYDLPYIKVGRLVRYKLGDLRKFLCDRTIAPTGANFK